MSQRVVLLVIVVLSGIMLILVPLEASEWYFASVGSFFLGFSAVAWNSTYVTIISEEAPRDSVGVYSGAALSIMYIGIIVGTPLLGYIIDSMTYTAMWKNVLAENRPHHSSRNCSDQHNRQHQFREEHFISSEF